MVDKNKLHPLLQEPVQTRTWVRGNEHPDKLIKAFPENLEPLTNLGNHHVVSARQFSRESVMQLCRLAAQYEVNPDLIQRPLQNKILISAFYEPSTRTRISFESAWHRLGGSIMSITDPSTTGIAKGESLEDVAEMFSNYGDAMVLRDGQVDSVYRMMEKLRIPIINAGNGIDEHPTQSLADMYAMFKWRPDLADKNIAPENRIKVGIIGTPNRMRTVRSLLLFLSLFSEAIEEVVVINPSARIWDDGQKEELIQSGLNVSESQELKPILPDLDVVYINSIAWIGDTYERLTGDMCLSKKSPLKKGAIILHPLARGIELDTDLDETPHNWYFAQARGGVYIRMALLTCISQRMHRILDVPITPA